MKVATREVRWRCSQAAIISTRAPLAWLEPKLEPDSFQRKRDGDVHSPQGDERQLDVRGPGGLPPNLALHMPFECRAPVRCVTWFRVSGKVHPRVRVCACALHARRRRRGGGAVTINVVLGRTGWRAAKEAEKEKSRETRKLTKGRGRYAQTHSEASEDGHQPAEFELCAVLPPDGKDLLLHRRKHTSSYHVP
jgi:hypothetical protein